MYEKIAQIKFKFTGELYFLTPRWVFEESKEAIGLELPEKTDEKGILETGFTAVTGIF
jgi:hypothetical protein